MNRSAGPGLRGSRSGSDRNGYVLRRAEALQWRGGSRGSREVSTTVVGSVLLFVGRHVAKVRLHRGNVRLVLRICELRNRDRGKNADDDDHDQKLNEGKTPFVAHSRLSCRVGKSPPAFKAFSVQKTWCQEMGQHPIRATREP